MSNILTATFGDERITRTEPLYQTDYGMVLQTDVELAASYQVNFQSGSNATVMIGDSEGVDIPDAYIAAGETIYAFFTAQDPNTSKYVIYQVIIPVIEAVTPDDIEPSSEQQSTIDRLIALIQDAQEQTAADAETSTAAAESALDSANSALGSKEAAEDSAEAAATSESNALGYSEDSEAWAVGERGGVAVGSSDETYHNNSKYYEGLAAQSATDASGYATRAENAQGYAEAAQTAAENAATQAAAILASAVLVDSNGYFYIQ